MALDVVDAQQRLVARKSQPLGHVHADEQRADEARPLRHGDAVEIVVAEVGLAHCLGDDGVDDLDMLSRGNLREDAAVLGVQIGLAGDDVAQDARPALDHRCCRLIARGLNCQDSGDRLGHVHGHSSGDCSN